MIKMCRDSDVQISKVSTVEVQGLGVETKLEDMDNTGLVMAMGWSQEYPW